MVLTIIFCSSFLSSDAIAKKVKNTQKGKTTERVIRRESMKKAETRKLQHQQTILSITKSRLNMNNSQIGKLLDHIYLYNKKEMTALYELVGAIPKIRSKFKLNVIRTFFLLTLNSNKPLIFTPSVMNKTLNFKDSKSRLALENLGLALTLALELVEKKGISPKKALERVADDNRITNLTLKKIMDSKGSVVAETDEPLDNVEDGRDGNIPSLISGMNFDGPYFFEKRDSKRTAFDESDGNESRFENSDSTDANPRDPERDDFDEYH